MDLTGQLDKFKKRAANPAKRETPKQALANRAIIHYDLQEPQQWKLMYIWANQREGWFKESLERCIASGKPFPYFCSLFRTTNNPFRK